MGKKFFASLPVTLLPSIFKWLPLVDRKNVRLTCHLWYDACNRKEVRETEKFVFHSGHVTALEKIGNRITHCNALCPNWEFQGVDFPKSLLVEGLQQLWQHNRNHIRSLSIYCCGMSESAFEDIVVHSSNLTHFRASAAYKFSFMICYSRFEAVLDRLIESKIQRRNLETLEFFVPDISREMAWKICRVFPCLRTFGLGGTAIVLGDYSTGSYSNSKHVDLENVLSPSITNFIWDYPLRLKRIPERKFKEVSIRIDHKTNFDLILDFFSAQTAMEKIKLVVCHSAGDSQLRTILFRILRSSLRLKELQLKSYKGFRFSSEEFDEFLQRTSQLERLKLHLLYGSLEHSLSENFQSRIEYTKLRRLRLSGSIDKRIIFEILNRCGKSLRYLTLKTKYATDKRSRKIFEPHTELQKLRMEGTPSQDGSSSSEQCWEYSFEKFPKLQHIDINPISPEMINDFLSSKSKFPDLKSFRLFPKTTTGDSIPPKVLQDVLGALSVKAPRLQILRVDERKELLERNRLINYCKKWKYLRFIVVNMEDSPWTDYYDDDDDDDVDDNTYNAFPYMGYFWLPPPRTLYETWLRKNSEKLFKKCPSLQWIVNETRSFGIFYDRFSKESKIFKHPETYIKIRK